MFVKQQFWQTNVLWLEKESWGEAVFQMCRLRILTALLKCRGWSLQSRTVVHGQVALMFVITAMSEGAGKMIVLDTRYCEELCKVEEWVGLFG